MSTDHHYSAFGLLINSEIEFPELMPAKNETGSPVVTIRHGTVTAGLENPVSSGVVYQAAQGKFLLKMDGLVRFLVQDGSEIVVQLEPDVEEREMRPFLLSSAMAALLHQRGMLALHSSGILIEKNGLRQAALFCGNSGVGKSTLVGGFHLRGYHVICDDKCAIVLENGVPTVYPGFPQIKLWQDSAARLEVPTENLPRVRKELEKFSLLVPEKFYAEPLPLAAVYQLGSQNEDRIDLDRVEGMGKFNLLLKNTFRRKFLEGLGMRPEHFKLAAAVAQKVKVGIIHRPVVPFRLNELMDRIEEDLELEHGKSGAA